MRKEKECPDGAKIIFLSSHSEPDYEREARAIGASGFINKERTAKDLLPALRIVKEAHIARTSLP